MRTNHVISINQIEKRRICQSSLTEGSDAGYLYNIYRNSIKHDSSRLEQTSFDFFKGCSTAKNANKYYGKCLSVLEDMKDNDRLVKVLETYMAAEIVPYITNLFDLDEQVERSNLANSTVATLTEASTVNKVCQRILNNNEKISERFNFDKYIRENGRKPMEPVVLKCCSMIDTYKTPGYAKLNIALEELSYIYQKNAISYDKPKMVQLVTEYFLSRSQHIKRSELKNYQSVLQDNCCITNEDLSGVEYFLKEDFSTEDKEDTSEKINPYDVTVTVDTEDILDVAKRKLDSLINPTENPVQTAFDVYKSSEDKTSETFSSFIDHTLAQKTSDIISVLPSILDWFRNFALANLLKLDDVVTFMTGLLDKSISLDHITSKEAKELRDILQNEINKLNLFLNDEDSDSELFGTYSRYMGTLQSIVDSVQQYIIDRESIDTNNALDKIKNEGAIMSLDEFKIFKFQNLITAAHKVDKALRKGSAKLTKAIKDKAVEVYSSLKNWLKEDYDLCNIESENLIECVADDGTFDHILRIYNVTDISNISEVTSAFKEFCAGMNNEFGTDSSIRIYTECIDNIIELHICDTTTINLTEEQYEEWEHTFSESEQMYCGYLMSLAEDMENFINLASGSLANDFAEVEATLEAEDIVSIIELSRYMGGMISYGRLEAIAEGYSINHPTDYSGNTGIKHALEDWKLEAADFGTQVEAISMLREAIDSCLITEADKESPNKIPNNVVKDEKEEKKPSKLDVVKDKVKGANDKLKDNGQKGIEKTKISFNTLKYALMDFKQKAKNLGDKGTKISHELDVYVAKFVNSVKALYTNDSREQIIKGSVIPSFHQLMGRLMVIGASSGAGGIIGAMTAVGGPAGALFGAAVTTFATIAISKNTTAKQRALMLDELDVELDVCERELSKADANGQVKKARAILMRKKKLQREMARIQYHIKDDSLIKPAEVLPDRDN
jgi:hypothetical protein